MVNKVILVGNLGGDAEVRFTNGGKSVLNLSVATTDKWKDKTGNEQTKTEWHRVTYFSKSAEKMAEWLKKGSMVFVEGRISYGKFEKKDGTQGYTTDIVAETVKTISRGGQQKNHPLPVAATQSDQEMDDIPF